MSGAATPEAENPMLAAALAYLARGRSIVPLAPRSKRPAVKLAPYLSGTARMTVDEARAYWTTYPDHGVAIITGTPSGLVVVDVDPRNGGDLEAAKRDCPTDLVAGTGGGGAHLVCTHPGGVVPCGKTSRAGVDRKGDGGYVVAPPSVHPETGEPYVWLHEGNAGALPAWVLDGPAPANVDGTHEPWVADALAYRSGVGNGEQEATLTRLAWYFSRRLPDDIAFGLLVGWVRGLHEYKPGDPWTAEHVKAKLDSAYAKRAKEEPATDVTITGSAHRGAGGGARRQTTAAEAIAQVVAACRPAQEHAKTCPPAVEWIVPRFLPAGVLLELHGDPKAGKSTLLGFMAGAIVNGTEFLGCRGSRGKVVWFTEQGRQSFAPILQKVGLHEHADLFVLYNHDVLNIPWAERVAGVVQVAKDVGARVVIVDTLSKLAGLRGENENSSGAILEALDFLEPAKAAGISVVVLHHDRKSGGDVINAGRGSNAIAGEADVIFQLIKDPRLAANARKLRYSGRLDDIAEEQVITLTADGYHATDATLVGQERSWRRLADWQLIASVAPRRGEAWASEVELARHLKGRLSRDVVRRRLSELRNLPEWCASPEVLAWEEGAGRGGGVRYSQCCGCGVDVVDAGEALVLTPVKDPACDEYHGGEVGGPQGFGAADLFAKGKKPAKTSSSRPKRALEKKSAGSRTPISADLTTSGGTHPDAGARGVS